MSARCAAAGVMGLALAALAPAVRAESAYVSDQLVISVTADAEGSGEKLASLHSGEQVEVLERQEDRVRIRYDGEHEGWVKSSYLSADPPARTRLEACTQELGTLRPQLSSMREELGSARAAAARVAAQPACPAAERATPTPARPLFDSGTGLQPGWGWVAGTGLVALAAGFLLGWRLLDRRIRQRYGGLKIY